MRKWGERKVIENIDKTIEVLCERIQKEAETSICIETVPDIVKALAELISAREKLNKEF